MQGLTVQEQTWLNAYRRTLEQEYPGIVKHMLLYGSKARGTGHSESDVDVLLLVKSGAGGLKRTLRRVGYLLAATSDVVPSILAYTETEWDSRRNSGSSFRASVERDALAVL